MTLWPDEIPEMKEGDEQIVVAADVAGKQHTMRIVATKDVGWNTGRRRYRVSCDSCAILVHPGSTSARAQIQLHQREPSERWPG